MFQIKQAAVLMSAVLMFGCQSAPPNYARTETRCLVNGLATQRTALDIKSVDNRDVAWERRGHLGHKVWLEPGRHHLSVVCYTERRSGLFTAETTVDLNVRPGNEYLLSAAPFLGEGVPRVDVLEKAVAE